MRLFFRNLPIASPSFSVYNTTTMPALQIDISEPLQQFVAGQIAELGLDRPDQYFEQLLEEERQRRLEEYYRSSQKKCNIVLDR